MLLIDLSHCVMNGAGRRVDFSGRIAAAGRFRPIGPPE
ncbi:hypothetical protein BURPS1655_C0477 [Burkholderia pseudomallei 1655]|nr:hypothetical protein BURPS1655_C0477 [Burkholderia pseudomallei 1655]